MEIGNGKFWLGDCLELMKDIPDGSVDMILCDLPYGTTACKWDTIIPFEPLWEQYWRVAKPNAAVVLTASQPFTTTLIGSQIDKFKYEWIWEKSSPGGFAQAKNMPLKTVEDITVFSSGVTSHKSQVGDRRVPYNPQGIVYSPRTVSNANRNNKGAESAFGDRPSHKANYVQEWSNYPKQVLRFKVERGLHPTQKPVALFEYLIKTYTNEGETVLDNCAGSGTTAVACEQTNRKWICIEQLPEYYYPAVMRVAGAVQ